LAPSRDIPRSPDKWNPSRTSSDSTEKIPIWNCLQSPLQGSFQREIFEIHLGKGDIHRKRLFGRWNSFDGHNILDRCSNVWIYFLIVLFLSLFRWFNVYSAALAEILQQTAEISMTAAHSQLNLNIPIVR
jgi:hypothetical protein